MVRCDEIGSYQQAQLLLRQGHTSTELPLLLPPTRMGVINTSSSRIRFKPVFWCSGADRGRCRFCWSGDMNTGRPWPRPWAWADEPSAEELSTAAAVIQRSTSGLISATAHQRCGAQSCELQQ
jgi:hypothetical protein